MVHYSRVWYIIPYQNILCRSFDLDSMTMTSSLRLPDEMPKNMLKRNGGEKRKLGSD